jgi:nucleotide-binding universal stress UspA family protein
MYQKILVAYNASRHSAIALREATDIARVSKGELHVLGIVSNTGALAIAETAGATNVLGMEHQRIQDALETVSDDLRDQGLNVATSILEGDPASQIIATAYRIRADLTVVGHGNKGVLARWFQGSVGAKLLSDLPCSLLIAAECPHD